MKLAHILPPSALKHVDDLLGNFHLTLPALYPEADYRHYYQNRAMLDYLILDNGIAEGRAIGFAHQLQMARSLRVTEIILPDRMHDMDRTLRGVAEVFYHAFEARHKFRYMLVLQGKDASEAVQCAERAMNMYPGIINCFGIPRHFADRQRRANRVNIAEQLRYRRYTMPIHLLGTHPENPGELFEWAELFSTLDIRSVDTSLAWNATLADQLLGPESLSYNLIVERQPIDEFRYAVPTDSQIELLRQNIEIMNGWMKP